jgi:hypothetical protein
MKKKSILILCSAFLVFYASGCSYKRVEFDSKSGKTNTVKTGAKFRVTLLENHEKNYYWTLKQISNQTAVSYLGSTFHGDKSGEVDFNFESLQAGETEISLTLFHYNDSTETKVFKVEVIK